MAKTLVFVHGSDQTQAKTPWMFYHLHPSKYGSTPVKSEGETFDVQYFDYAEGRRKEWKGWTATRDPLGPPSPPEGGPGSGDLIPKRKIRDMFGVETGAEFPSVEAFYRWVKQTAEHSIASIQIFSHGTIFQPVLFASSFEWGDDLAKRDDLTAERDPHDTEFRLRDFEGSNPLAPDPWGDATTGEIGKFRKALDPDCFIKVWGCGEQTQTGHGEGIRKLVTRFLKAPSGARGDTQRNTLVLAYLDQVRQSWPFRLAEALDMPVWAGPVGWGTDPFNIDGTPKEPINTYKYKATFSADLKKKEWWWRASINFRRNKAIAEKFFKGALKAKMDVLGYVEYKKSWVEAAEAAATAALNPPSTNPLFDSPQNLAGKLAEEIRELFGR